MKLRTNPRDGTSLRMRSPSWLTGNVTAFAKLHDPEARIIVRCDRAAQIIDRLHLAVVAELERAVVNGQARRGAEDPVRFDGLGGIDVRGHHEPARLIRADGKERQADRRKEPRDL